MKSSNPRIFLSVSESSTMWAILCHSFLPLVPFMCGFHAPKNTFTAASKYRRWTKRSSVTDIASDNCINKPRGTLNWGVTSKISESLYFIESSLSLRAELSSSELEDCHFILGGGWLWWSTTNSFLLPTFQNLIPALPASFSVVSYGYNHFWCGTKVSNF